MYCICVHLQLQRTVNYINHFTATLTFLARGLELRVENQDGECFCQIYQKFIVFSSVNCVIFFLE